MKNTIPSIIILLSFAVLLTNCGNESQSSKIDSTAEESQIIENSNIEIETARREMLALMNSYLIAFKSLDSAKVIDHYYNSPEFKLISDGHVSNYKETVKSVCGILRSLSKVDGRWDTVYLSVLSPDVVTAMAPFHEVLIDKDGKITPLKGEVTWTAKKDNDRWRFIYGHATHEIDEEIK